MISDLLHLRTSIAYCTWMLVFAVCSSVFGEKDEATSEFKTHAIKLTSSAFADHQTIPTRYTCAGQDISPPLTWKGVPLQSRELVLICVDPDALTMEPRVHWVLYGVTPRVTHLPAGILREEELRFPEKARQGVNWQKQENVGYCGPLAPDGPRIHHFHFTLYALSQKLFLPIRATKGEVIRAMQGHVLATGKIVGTVERKP